MHLAGSGVGRAFQVGLSLRHGVSVSQRSGRDGITSVQGLSEKDGYFVRGTVVRGLFHPNRSTICIAAGVKFPKGISESHPLRSFRPPNHRCVAYEPHSECLIH